MKAQLVTMLEMQDAMNTRVNADWKTMDFEWYRAIWVECAELMDHFGWKWWKKQTPDRAQVVLELVDIWHFGLSIRLSDGNSLDSTAELIAKELAPDAPSRDFLLSVEAFAEKTIASRSFDVEGFSVLMSCMELSFDELYKRYIGKNVLNFFRQDNGYQDGSYRKIWQEREDNEHLVEVVDMLDAKDDDFKEKVYAALAQRYSQSS